MNNDVAFIFGTGKLHFQFPNALIDNKLKNLSVELEITFNKANDFL